MKRSHDELRDLLAPYVLGAVSPEEREDVRGHLRSCPACRLSAEALAAGASSLALSVVPEPLPEGFARRVLERLEEPVRAAAEPGRTGAWRRLVGDHALAYAAFALVVAVLGASLVDAWRDEARHERGLRALLRGGGMTLDGTDEAAGRMVPTAGGGLLFVTGLPEAPRDHVYQLWVLREPCDADGCRPVGAGTFDTSGGFAVVETDRSLRDAAGVAVTIEPTGGSAAPTTDPVITSG
jgi:anti-sigma-K factor RskA